MSFNNCIQCSDLNRSNQHKLSSTSFSIRYKSSSIKNHLSLPRRYTCVYHNNIGSLSIGHNYDKDLLSSVTDQSAITGKWLKNKDHYEIHIKALISNKDDHHAPSRNKFLCENLSVILEAIASAESSLLKEYPYLGNTRVLVYFDSLDEEYDRAENWHSLKYWTQDYESQKNNKDTKTPKKKKKYPRRPPQMCPTCAK